MVFFKAEKLQRLADLLQRIQGEIEREGGEASHRVEQDLTDAARRAGIDLDVARVADVGTLESVLAPGGDPGTGKCWAVAEVLFLDGLRAHGLDERGEARELLEKARALYGRVGDGLRLPEGAPTPTERIRRIDELIASGSP